MYLPVVSKLSVIALTFLALIVKQNAQTSLFNTSGFTK